MANRCSYRQAPQCSTLSSSCIAELICGVQTVRHTALGSSRTHAIVNSNRVRPRPVPGRTGGEVPHAQPVHLPPIQRGTEDLFRPAGTCSASPRLTLADDEPQFAYNEVSFALIRLLQHFISFELAQVEANPAAIPPPGWAISPGSNGKDDVRIHSHLTMYIKVRVRNLSVEGVYVCVRADERW